MKLLLSILFACLTLPLLAQHSEYCKIRIFATPSELQNVALDIDHGYHRKGAYFETDLRSDLVHLLDEANIDYNILATDAAKFYRTRNSGSTETKSANSCGSAPETFTTPNGFSLGAMGGFFTYQEFQDHLDSMVARFPHLITAKSPIGSYQTDGGKSIHWLRISNNPNTNQAKPQILLTAVHHAREPASLSQLIMFMYYLLEEYGTNPEVTYLVDNLEFYFIPMVNPDGYIHNEQNDPNGGGGWRKNRHDNGDGTFGVDLNRNYGYNWAHDNQGSSGNSSSDTYRGDAAFSEPETQAVKAFCEGKDIKICLNYHTYGNLLIYPWGYEEATFTPDSAQFTEYAIFMTQQNNYLYGTGDQTVGYATNGDSDDWMYGEQTSKNKIMSFTPEAGDDADGFWPAANRIETICHSNIRQNLNAAHLLLNTGKVTDRSPQIFTELTPYISYDFTRLGMDVSAISVNITPVSANIQSVGAPNDHQSTALLESTHDSIQITLDPSISDGETFTFILSVDNGIHQQNHTITKTYGNYTTIFHETGETANNWNSTHWDLTSEFAWTPDKSWTDSPYTNYSNNKSRSIEMDTVVDLTYTKQALLSFHAKWEIEKGWDYCQLAASADGVSWQPLCGKHTTTGNGNQAEGTPLYDGFQNDWVYEEIDLANFRSGPVKLRFTMVSDQAVSEDGFYFDELRIKTIPIPSITMSEASTAPTCGVSDGSITVALSGGQSPYTYLWSDGSSASTSTGLSPGEHLLTVTDLLGNAEEYSFLLSNPSSSTITPVTTNISCNGANDGSIAITTQSSITVYLWSNAASTATVTGLSPDTYTLIYTDQNGCETTEQFTISEPQQLGNVNTVDHGSTNDDGIASIQIIGGTSPYEMVWSTGASTTQLTGLTPGTYGFTITDANDCTKQGSVTIDAIDAVEKADPIALQVFPNPSSGEVRFISREAAKIKYEIYSVLGVLIEQNSFERATRVRLQTPGHYLVKFYTNKGITNRTITIR